MPENSEIALVNEKAIQQRIKVMRACSFRFRIICCLTCFASISLVQNLLAQTPAKPRLAFASDRTGRLQIHTVQPDPLGAVLQTTSEGSGSQEARAPDWSRSGKIAYQFGASGARGIHEIGSDGSGQQRLTFSGRDERDPSWSPDGKFIVYASNENGTYDLWIHDLVVGTNYLLIAGAREQLRPAWSPDANWIAYVSNEGSNNEIMVVPVSVVDGIVFPGSPVPKTSNTDNDFNPCWSPDSLSIAFQSTRGGNTDIYRMALASGEASIVRLTTHSGSDSNPAWSPDGATLAFVSDRDGNSEIYVMSATSGEADTAALRRVTNDSGQDVDPAWEPQNTVDLVAVALAWNNTIGGMDARYRVDNGALSSATTAKLFWANGTSAASILSTTPIFMENIPAGAGGSGASGVITFNVPNSSLTSPPQGTTYVLLVVDYDPPLPNGVVYEANENNNSVVLPWCPVGPLIKPKFPAQGYDESCLVQEMRDALACFEGKVGSANIRKTTACRGQDYQDHLREIWEHARSLDVLTCVAVVSAYPRQYAVVGSECAGCQPIIEELNAEIRDHFNQPNFPSQVAKISLHTQGKAVDWTIAHFSSSAIRTMAESCGLKYSPVKGEPWHFVLEAAPARQYLTFQARSPVNILVRDPSGRRIGFDPIANAAVNTVGPTATYSGPGTTPQIIEIGPGEVLFGNYLVSGVGTGSGAYTIDVRVDTDDDEVDPVQTVLATGTTQVGQPLTSISPIDCIATTVLLNVTVDSGNIVLRAQAWATNTLVEWTTDISTGTWNAISGKFDPINGLTITNPITGSKFFRLRPE